MEYLSNLDNILREATLTMTNIVASAAVYRTDESAKAGGGEVSLSGLYTGQSDATFDVEIVDATISGTPRISLPVFRGVGNGAISSVAAISGSAAQEITISLADLGTETTKAYAPFQSVTLRARASGTSGNAINVSINNSGLTRTPTAYSLNSPLVAQNNEYIGDQWNFGHSALNPEGTIRTDAPRISFGDDPQIYRAYKRYQNGNYIYSFSPVPQRDVAQGEKVLAVTGTRTVTITDGITPETYTGIVTLYDLLSQINATSALVEVVGVVANDLHPGGMGINDLSVQTSSYVNGITKDGSRYARRATLGLTVAATAPTEHFVIECTENATANQERWSVSGTVSGDLPDAITGDAYAHTPLGFTIPEGVLPAFTPSGDITAEFRPVSRSEDTPIPCLNFYQPRLGVNATDKTLTWVYTHRPTVTCDCDAQPVEGGPNPDCLGVDDLGGDMATLADAHRLRLERVRNWSNDWIKTTRMLSNPYEIVTETADIRVARAVTDLLVQTLNALYTNTDARLRNTAWQASHTYAVDDIREPVTANGYRYRASAVTGTSNSTEPTWPVVIGATVTDSGVVWECIGLTPIALFDQEFATVKSNLVGFIDGPSAPAWETQPGPTLTIFPRIIPTTRNAHSYVLVKSPPALLGAGSGTEPTWPTSGGTVADGVLTWQDDGAYWIASHSYPAGSIITPYNGRIFKNAATGTSSATEPNWDANTVTDGGITWVSINNPAVRTNILSPETTDLGGVSSSVLEYAGTFAEQMAIILSSAGIEPSFSLASTLGNACWHDHPSEFWWVCQDDTAYMPAFTNVYYHSVKKGVDEHGNPILINTEEFGFAFQGCEDQLERGDTMVVTIKAGANSRHVYQQGDRFEFDVIRGAALPFGGGQSGSDTLTFLVRGTAAGAPGTFANYALNTVTLNTYSNNGLSFAIVPGAIDFALGDTFTFSIEGGHFRWRKNGGSWSSSTAIAATASLSDGLSANFIGGNAPSWVALDRWSFTALSVNGPDQLRQPTDPRAAWASSTSLTIAPTVPADALALFICDHTIASTATIRLQGSNDDFSTTPLNAVVPWAERNIYYRLNAVVTYAKYRVTCDQSGISNWVYLGVPRQPTIRTGVYELGKLTKAWNLPGLTTRKSLGATVEHSGLTEASAASLVALLSHACQYDDRRFGIVPNTNETSEASLVSYQLDSIELKDQLDFQPRDNIHRLITASLTLEAVA